MKPDTRRSRGFTVILVILLLTLITAAVMSLTMVFATQFHRTQAAGAGAQLRQMLLAAMPLAQDELANRGAGAGSGAGRSAQAPVPVEGATLTLIFSPDGPDRAIVRADARYHDMRAMQTIQFARQVNGQWTAQEVHLDISP